jgi:hypothetical protein
MTDTDPDVPDQLDDFLQEMLDDNVDISGTVAEIDRNTWAIHGAIAVDGDVILAEFATYDEAKATLNRITRG